MVNSQDSDAFPVVIIGAGLAGLIAGAHLANRGIPPLIIEADSKWPGGRLSGGEPDTFEYKGREWSFTPDHGVHATWGNYVNLRTSLKQFTEAEFNPSVGEEWINRWGREVRAVEAGNIVRYGVIPAPFHYLALLLQPHFWRTIMPWDFLSLPGYLFGTLWSVGFDPLKEKSALDGLMMKELFRGWTPNLKATFRGLGVNLLAAPESEVTLSGMIAALRFYTMLRRDAWEIQFFQGNSHNSIIMPLVKYIENSGGKCLLGTTAIEIRRANQETIQVVSEDTTLPGKRVFHTDNVILAMNAPSTKRLLFSSKLTQQQAELLNIPNGLRNIVVRLWFDMYPRPGTASGMLTGDFVPDNFFWLHRLYEEFAEWRQAGGSAVELHFYGEDSLLDLPDRNILVLAVDEIQRAFPELKGHFVHGTVRRNSKVQTAFRVPTKTSLHVKTPWENVYAAGDWIGYDTAALWMERSAVTGIAAANEVIQHYNGEPYEILIPLKPGLFVEGIGLIVHLLRKIFKPIIRLARRLRHG